MNGLQAALAAIVQAVCVAGTLTGCDSTPQPPHWGQVCAHWEDTSTFYPMSDFKGGTVMQFMPSSICTISRMECIRDERWQGQPQDCEVHQ